MALYVIRCVSLNRFGSRSISRRFSSLNVAAAIQSDPVLKEESGQAKDRLGRFQVPPVEIPTQVNQVLFKLVSGHHDTDVFTQAAALNRYLKGRKLPTSDYALRQMAMKLEGEVMARLLKQQRKLDPNAAVNFEDIEANKKEVERQVKSKLVKTTYRWKPIDYGSDYRCLVYAIARFAPNFAALCKIFNEIRSRDPNFAPSYALDLGSGVGSTFWAIHRFWPKVSEYFCVDTSAFMNNFAQLLIKGDPDASLPEGFFFRQFLPAQHERNYNLAVCAFSLMEFPTYEARMNALSNLWEKTDSYLVIVESGTMAGYQAVLEARDFIISCGRQVYKKKAAELVENVASDADKEKAENVELPTLLPKGFVFSPCPHEESCPRLIEGSQPCNFEVRHFDPSLRAKHNLSDIKTELYSYVVLKKGERPLSVAEASWPRLTAPIKQRRGHLWCEICTANGKLESSVLSPARCGSELYKCAKDRSWGDLLPAVVVSKPAGDTT